MGGARITRILWRFFSVGPLLPVLAKFFGIWRRFLESGEFISVRILRSNPIFSVSREIFGGLGKALRVQLNVFLSHGDFLKTG